MEINRLNGYAFDMESGVLGVVVSVNFFDETTTITADGENMIETSLDNVIFLQHIGKINGQEIINHDVLESFQGKLYEVELVDNGNVVFHLLDESLNRVSYGTELEIENLNVMDDIVELVGNIHTILAEQEVYDFDFNFKMVTELDSEGEIEGFYFACNNKIAEEIDLIKFFEGEDYERMTVSYEEYLEMLEVGDLVEVHEEVVDELIGYMKEEEEEEVQPIEKVEKVEEVEEVEDICFLCEKDIFQCTCTDWD